MQALGYLEEVLKWDENLKPLYIYSIEDLPVDTWDSLTVGLYLFCDDIGQVLARHISLGDFGKNW